MAGNIVKWWKHKILGGYKQFSGKKKNPFVYLIGSRNKQKTRIPKEMMVYVEWNGKGTFTRLPFISKVGFLNHKIKSTSF